MALADRISPGSRHKITNAFKVSSISASFAEGKHVDLQDFPGEAALLYQIQKMEEDIDELRRYITNEATGSAVKSIKEVNVDDLPSNSIGLSTGDLYVIQEKDKTKTLKVK